MTDEDAVQFAGLQRVRVGGGSHVEPPFDEGWDDLTKLRWCARVSEVDTGLRIRVSPGGHHKKRWGKWVPVAGSYSILVGGSCTSSFDFDSAWTFLTGVTVGVQQVTDSGRHLSGGES